MKITWFGTVSILLETEKSRILFDPFVPMRGSKVQTTLSDYAGVDRIVATHGHFDHVRNIPALARQNPGLRVYCSETPCRSLQKAGTAAQVLVKIAPGDTVRIGDVSIDVYQGKHAALEGLNLSALLLPRVYRYCYCIPRLLLELLRYPEKKETLFFDVCTENKHIFLLGSMNLADEVDYPSGCDLLILPYAGYRDNLAKADQMMNCLRPDPGHQAGIPDSLFHIRDKTEENRIGPERRKNGRPGGQSPGHCPGGRAAA